MKILTTALLFESFDATSKFSEKNLDDWVVVGVEEDKTVDAPVVAAGAGVREKWADVVDDEVL